MARATRGAGESPLVGGEFSPERSLECGHAIQSLTLAARMHEAVEFLSDEQIPFELPQFGVAGSLEPQFVGGVGFHGLFFTLCCLGLVCRPSPKQRGDSGRPVGVVFRGHH